MFDFRTVSNKMIFKSGLLLLFISSEFKPFAVYKDINLLKVNILGVHFSCVSIMHLNYYLSKHF